MSDRSERESDTRLRRAYGGQPPAPDHPDDDAWERLATGELAAADRAALIAHVTRCAQCADVYRTVLAVVDEARAFDPYLPAAAPAPVVEPSLLASSRLRPVFALAASLLVAAGGIALYRLMPDRVPPGAAAVAPPATAPSQPEPPAPPVDLTADKPAVSLPMAMTVPMRGPTGAAARRFLEEFAVAIAPYRADRFDDAAAGLRALAIRHPDVAEVWFYLGVSELFAGRAGPALDALDRAGDGGAARADLPWIRAVALQRAGRGDQLRQWLTGLCGAPGPAREKACAAVGTPGGARP